MTSNDIVGGLLKELRDNLTSQEVIILQEMNRGMYLITTNGKIEGLSTKERIANIVKSGTIQVLVDAGMIYRSDVIYKTGVVKYLLTDAGRRFRKI
jgi:DNA-binding HxlR family transcriptional regulator